MLFITNIQMTFISGHSIWFQNVWSFLLLLIFYYHLFLFQAPGLFLLIKLMLNKDGVVMASFGYFPSHRTCIL